MRSNGHPLMKAAAWGGLLFMHFPIAVIAMYEDDTTSPANSMRRPPSSRGPIIINAETN